MSRVCSVRYRYSRYRYGYRTELTEVAGTGVDAVPNLPKCPVPVYTGGIYRRYASVRTVPNTLWILSYGLQLVRGAGTRMVRARLLWWNSPDIFGQWGIIIGYEYLLGVE